MNRFTYFTRFRSTHGAPDLQAMGRSALFSFVVFLQAGCATPAIVPLGVLQLASEQGAQGRTFGGISGLDHHPTSKAWLLISDDRSTHGPARFYEAVLNWRQDRLVNAQIRGQRPLQNEKALLFPPESDRSNIDDEVADPESIRFDPIDDSIIWSSEGDSSRGFSPTIRRMTMEGGALGVIPLPSALGFDAAEDRGAIPNKTVEGLAWTAGGQALWAAMEGPLKQDRLSSDNDQGALVRLTLLTRTGETIRQKAYEVDPVIASRRNRAADSGVSEVLMLDDQRMLVLERAGLQTESGAFVFRTRLYCADLNTGDDIQGLERLAGRRSRPVAKRLIADLAEVGLAYNFEGMSWGPKLSDDRASLVFVSDNNFEEQTPTVIAAFALSGPNGVAAWADKNCP